MRADGYEVRPFSRGRQVVAAAAAVGRGRNTIHLLVEADVTGVRRALREHRARTGQRLSLTAYVVACLARAVAAHPQVNAFRRGRRLYVLDDVTIGVVVERDADGQRLPEPLTVRAADRMTYAEINAQVQAVDRRTDAPLGALSGAEWIVRRMPSRLYQAAIRAASRNVRIATRYGVVGVTAVGMFGPAPLWLLPLSGATVVVAIGSVVTRAVPVDGGVEAREHLCLTVSVDHDIVDGAPAARLAATLCDLIADGDLLLPALEPRVSGRR